MGKPGFDYRDDVQLDVECHHRVVTGDVSVSDISYDNGTGVILARGGTADGRHYFVDEATRLAGVGMTALLPAASLPEHGDQQATADAIRANVLTHRRGLDVLTVWVEARIDRLCYFGHSAGAFHGAILSAVEPRLSGLALASYGAGTLVRLAAADVPGDTPATDDTATPPQAQTDRRQLFTVTPS